MLVAAFRVRRRAGMHFCQPREHDSARLHGEAKLPYACAAQTRLAWEMEVLTSGDMAHLGVPAGAAVPCGELKMNR